MWAYWRCKWVLKFQLFSCATDRSETTDQSIMQTRLSKKILSCVFLKLKLSNLIIIMYFLACEQLSSLVNSSDGMCKLCKPYSTGQFQYHYFITWNATIKWDNDSWNWENVLKFSTRMLSGRKHYVERELLSSEPLKGGESWKRSPSLERKGCFWIYSLRLQVFPIPGLDEDEGVSSPSPITR